jgi:hypothetical protein
MVTCTLSFYFSQQSTCTSNCLRSFLIYSDLVCIMSCILSILHDRGTFPAGVCKYLLRNNWINRISSCHHLWTIPLVFWGCGGVFQWLAVPLSGIIIILNVLLSRWMTPISIENSGDEDDEKYLYLNINLSHEMVSSVLNSRRSLLL